MCQNQEHPSQKQKKRVQSAAILHLTSGATHHCMHWVVDECLWSEVPPPAALYETEAGQLEWQLHVPEPRARECRDQPADEVLKCIISYSSFFCSFFWKQTGKMESTARTPSTAREFQDTASPAVVSLYSVVPALIATKEGGATPVDQPGESGQSVNKNHTANHL